MPESNKTTVDAIVKNYLLSRGYEKAAAEMDNERPRAEGIADPSPDAMSSAARISIDAHSFDSSSSKSQNETLSLSSQVLSTVIEDIVILGVNSGNYRLYDEEYSSLRSWSLTSLDIVKSEASLLLLPTFVHCYIGLVRLGCTNEAIRFWRTWEKDHHEGHADELRMLSTLTAAEQLQSDEFLSANAFIRQALISRFKIKMSTFAYGLLTTFIVQNNLLLVASIMNDRMTFEKASDFPGVSHHVVQLEGHGAGSSGRVGAKALDTVKLTAPGRGNEHKDDALSREWVNVLVRPRALIRQRGKDRELAKAAGRGGHTSDRREDDDRDDKKKARVLSSSGTAAGSRGRGVTACGSALDPSVIFSTITNASEGMTCLHISKGVTHAAAGFKDSCLRVWRLNEKDSSVSKSGCLVDGQWAIDEVLPVGPGSSKGAASSSASSSFSSSTSSFVGTEGRGKKPQTRDVMQLFGHSKAIYGVSQSSDEDCRLVLSCSADETIRLWDTSVSQCVGKYSCVGPSWGVSFSPLGYYFASANQAMTAAVYSTDRPAPLRLFTGHTSDVTAVCWHDNATLIASSADDKTARLWDLRSGKCVRLFAGSPSPLSCVALSSAASTGGTGSLLAAGSDAGSICVWDIGTGRHMSVMQGHSDTVHSVSFSMDGSVLASGSADCSLKIFDISAAMTAQSSFAAAPNSTACPSSSSRLTGTSIRHGPTGVPAVCQPRHTYHTKFSPVFFVDYTDRNLLYSGGPFSLYCATTRGTHGGQGTGDGDKINLEEGGEEAQRSISGSLTATEQETAAALGLAQSVISS